MAMSEEHKRKIAQGVKAYHQCAKSKGCGKKKEKKESPQPPEPPKKKKPLPKIPTKEKPKKERPQPPKPRILALENIKEKTKPKKEKKKFKVNNAKRSMANFNYQREYKSTPAKVLGVSARASPEEIKKAFRPFLKFHPDKRATGDLEKYQKYSSAYSALLDSIDILE